MTQDPNLSAEKVAELEHKLAAAAAEVAKVQAELAAAKPPSTGIPGAVVPSAPAVPYAGSEPHEILINGQRVTPGSGDLAAMLRQFMPAAGAASGTPTVLVNGQQVSGATPADLSAYLTPEVTQQIHSSLQQLGLDQSLGAMFGQYGAPTPPAEPEYVAALAEPPRHVPFSYKLATFDLSLYEWFILVIGCTAPIAVWIFAPMVVPGALIAAVLVVAVFRGRRYVLRIGILKWGKVATVTNNDTLSKGTYYSGMTYNNMRKRQARGWDAETIWYSGPGYKNQVDYTVDGVPGKHVFRGLQYTQGVILADPRKKDRALCVSQFPYSVKPGPDGQLTGELSAWLWGGIIATLVIEVTVVYLAVASVLDLWVNR